MKSTSGGAWALDECKAGLHAHLVDRGYSRSAATKHRALLGEFAGWAESKGIITVEDFATVDTAAFFEQRSHGVHKSLRSSRSLETTFAYLREIGVVGPPRLLPLTDVLDVFADRYARFLTSERGLASGTAVMYLRVARRLAAERVVAGSLDWHGLHARSVIDFVQRACTGCGVSWARQVVSATRCLLRYLQLEGLSDFALEHAVLSVAGAVGSLPPRGISRVDIDALLASCDRQSAMGRRDYALLMLLCRLGLRGGETVGLTLDDIDWRAGEIVVAGKNGRHDRLPLHTDVGEALADYLRHGRPQTADRAVFVRHCAPIRGLGATGSVRSVLERACVRAGVAYVHPHRLRHTVATDMLAAGVSLRDIGQVLGHQSTATTAVYAKADLDALRSVTHAWPQVSP